MTTTALFNPLPNGEDELSVSFSYIDRSYVKVYKRLHADGVDQIVFDGDELVEDVDYSWIDDGTIQLTTPADGLTDFLVKRVTTTNPIVTQQPSSLSSAKINLADRQALNVAEEANANSDDAAVKAEEIGRRTLRAPEGETLLTLPSASERANLYLSFLMDGSPIMVPGTGADLGLREALAALSGAGMLGFAADEVYPDNSVGARMKKVVFASDAPYSAKGDGVTDDKVALQAAIDNAPANAVLVIPPGVYQVGSGVVVARNDLTILGYGATIKAMAATSFQYVLYGTMLSNVKVYGLTVDANKQLRAGGQNVRYVGAYISLSTDCEFVHCTGKNALGYASTPGIGLSFGGCVRSHIKNCHAIDCGGTSGTDASDGFYVSGDNCTINGCDAENCTDTGMVIENSNNSGIIGGTVKNCNAAFAITNATNFPKRGNFIKGCTGIDWNSAVTGGIQIGCFGTGDLLDTSVDAILVAPTGGKGTGPAINVRKTSTGKVDGATIEAIINGASTQGILVDGINVRVNDCMIRGTTNACVQFQDGATGEVQGSKLKGGTFGVYAAGTANVRTTGNNIEGNGTQSYGLYAAGTSTILSEFDKIDGQTSFRTGKDGGATMQSARFTGTTIELNETKVVGPRDTGWAADTGTAKKSANATYTAPTFSNPPTQAEVQALGNVVQDLSRTVKALKDAGLGNGSLGA